MTRPRLLDLFCGAGGLTKGYQSAGFYVVGVDINPQPNYCGDEFIQGNAIDRLEQMIALPPYRGSRYFNAIHASPPCQHYANVTKWRGDPDDHDALIGPTRELLVMLERLTGIPWVMENVRTTELRDPFVLCGSMFGLKVRRHRYFETSWPMFELVPACQHGGLLPFEHKGERAYADAMGCEWMTNREARQAVPPAYAEWIGSRLLDVLGRAAA